MSAPLNVEWPWGNYGFDRPKGGDLDMLVKRWHLVYLAHKTLAASDSPPVWIRRLVAVVFFR